MLKKILKLFIYIIGVFALGIMISIAVLQEDPWVKKRVERIVNNIVSHAIQAPFACTIKKINIFTGTFMLTDIHAYSSISGDWSLDLGSCECTLSWLDSIRYWFFALEINCNKLIIKSLVKDNQLAGIEPIKHFLATPALFPVLIKACTIYNSSFTITDTLYNHHMNIDFSGSIMHNNGVFKSNFITSSGSLRKHNDSYIENITGPLSFTINPHDDSVIGNISLNISLDVVKSFDKSKKNEHCKVVGTFNNKHGHFRLHNIQHSFISNCLIDCRSEKEWEITSNAHIPLNIFECYCNAALKGTCIIQSRFRWASEGISGNSTINIQDLEYNNYKLGNAQIKIRAKKEKLKALLRIYNSHLEIRGKAGWLVEQSKGWLNFHTTQEIDCGSLVNIVPRGFSLDVQCDKYFNAQMQLSLSLYKKIEEKILKIDTDVVKTGNLLTIKSTTGNNALGIHTFKSTFALNPLALISCDYYDGTLRLFNLSENNGTCDYALIKKWVQEFFPSGLSGSGLINFTTSYKSDSQEFLLNYELAKANIRLPFIYNIIKNAAGNIVINIHEKAIYLKNMHIDFYKGTLRIPYCKFWLNSTYQLSYTSIPLVCDNFLINYGKEFISLITGCLMITYDKNKDKNNKIWGDIVLNKSYIHSLDIAPSISSHDVSSASQSLKRCFGDSIVDVTIKTGSPIHIKTSLITAHMHGNFSLKGSVKALQSSGIITLVEGKIMFPYKSLYLTTGKIILNSSNFMDSSIELRARNAIKKYTITLTVDGLLNKPVVRLDASPYLKEEQVITLLLAGSEEGSFSVAMPHMIMQTLENVILNKSDDNSKVQRFFKALLKSLKHVRVVPRISDIHNSSNSDTIKGALEFDINDRIKATIQNNLNLSENTRVEVECALSDDVNIKAIKDDQGDLEAELEMKWKF